MLVAVVADQRVVPAVLAHVQHKLVPLAKLLLADVARPLAGKVRLDVPRQGHPAAERFSAVLAVAEQGFRGCFVGHLAMFLVAAMVDEFERATSALVLAAVVGHVIGESFTREEDVGAVAAPEVIEG